MANKPLDIVVWGATGFTGKLVAKYLYTKYGNISWGIAGRSQSKLEAVVKFLEEEVSETKSKKSHLPKILVGDAHDQQSVDDVVSQTRVLISCAGPFSRFGESVVSACVRLKTDYVDITGEPNFVQDMIDKYHDRAVANGVKIISQCGFDSIPSDLGTMFLVDDMRKKVKEVGLVKCFVGMKGIASGGTIESAFEIVAMPFRKVVDVFLNPNALYAKEKRGDFRNLNLVDCPQAIPNYEVQGGFWSGFNPLGWPNTLIVRRSNFLLQQLQKESYGERFSYQERLQTAPQQKLMGFVQTCAIFFAVLLFSVVMFFAPLRNWLRSFLSSPGQGPSQQQMDEVWFKLLLIGSDATDPTNTVKAEVVLKKHDPGYKGTSMMVAEAGLCLALDRDELSNKQGGCVTPSVGLGYTLIHRLSAAGMKFNIIDPLS